MILANDKIFGKCSFSGEEGVSSAESEDAISLNDDSRGGQRGSHRIIQTRQQIDTNMISTNLRI